MKLAITVEVEGIEPVKINLDIPEKDNKPAELPDCKRIFCKETSVCCNGFADDLFVEHQETYCNEKLKYHGYLFLNEVYDALGLSRTKYGHQYGWVYDTTNPKKIKITTVQLDKDGRRVLDFNIDGDLLKLL